MLRLKIVPPPPRHKNSSWCKVFVLALAPIKGEKIVAVCACRASWKISPSRGNSQSQHYLQCTTLLLNSNDRHKNKMKQNKTIK